MEACIAVFIRSLKTVFVNRTMERILFYQNERLNTPSCIFIDGRPVNSTEATEQLDILFGLVERLGGKKEPCVARLDKYYVVKGFLAHNDEIGRLMTFMYVLPAATYNERELLQHLTQDLSVGGKSLGEETRQAILNYESNKRVQYNAIIVAAIVALLVALYLCLNSN